MASTATYHDILAGVALRINALKGTDPVALQITYSTRPLTDELFDSSIFPMDAIRDSILNAEQRLAAVIANTGNHPWRTFLGGPSETTVLMNGDLMPSIDVNGVGIIGIYGSVLDVDDPTLICTEQPVEVLRRRQLTPNLWIIPAYNYSLDGNGIIHTRPNGVTVQVCVYDYATQQAAFDANEPILLPDVLAEALICGGVAGLVRDDEFTTQASLYVQYFNAAEQSIISGLTSVSQLAVQRASLTQGK